MVRVQGKVRQGDKSGYYKINENFRTKKEADKFIKFIGKAGKVKITSYRKPRRRQSNPFNFSIPKFKF